MNNEPNGRHPAEEELMELALHGNRRELEKHLEGCPACARMVKEFREVKQQVASFPDEEVPISLEQRVFRHSRHGHSGRPSLLASLGALLSNPLLVAAMVVIVVILLYLLVGSEVFKVP